MYYYILFYNNLILDVHLGGIFHTPYKIFGDWSRYIEYSIPLLCIDSSLFKKHMHHKFVFLYTFHYVFDSLQESHFRPRIQIWHVISVWQFVHFGLSYSNRTPPWGHSPRSTKTAWVPFWIKDDLLVIGSVIIVDISWMTISWLGPTNHPGLRYDYWPPDPLFICATWSINWVTCCVVKQQ